MVLHQNTVQNGRNPMNLNQYSFKEFVDETGLQEMGAIGGLYYDDLAKLNTCVQYLITHFAGYKVNKTRGNKPEYSLKDEKITCWVKIKMLNQ